MKIKAFLLKWLTVPGLMSFYYKGHRYRITGYYYRYFFKDGTASDPYKCRRSQANCIGGYGVCGQYITFDKVEGVHFKISKTRLYFYDIYNSEWDKRRRCAEHKLKFVTGAPKGLTKAEFQDLMLDFEISSFLD